MIKIDKKYSCKNYEDSLCLCYKKCDCINKRLEETFEDIVEMAKETNSKEAQELKNRYIQKLADIKKRLESGSR